MENNIIMMPTPNISSSSMKELKFLVIHSLTISKHGFYINDQGKKMPAFLTEAIALDFIHNSRKHGVDYASAHELVKLDGTRVKFATSEQVTWHAGESSYKGYVGLNNYGYGVELISDYDNKERYKFNQYMALINIAEELNIPSDFVVTHYQISPGRKTDPEKFNLQLLKDMIKLKAS